MKKTISLVIILALALTFVATGCDSTSDEVLYWNLGADPKTLDPGLNGASDGGDMINQLFEGLIREVGGEVYPGIAETWDISADNTVYTFHLRDSKWSDGSKLTAYDFEYAWKRVIEPATASEYAWLFEYTNIVGAYEALYEEGSLDDVGIVAIDDSTLEVTLTSYTPYFLGLMSFYTFMPVQEDAVLAGPDGVWAKDSDLFVSNGPFVLTEYSVGDKMVIDKNKNYWNKNEVMIGKIVVQMIEEASTAYTAYTNGEFQVLSDVPPAEISRLKAEEPDFYIFALLGTYYYSINLDNDLFDDMNIRKALVFAVDRQAICDTLQSGNLPATGFVPPAFKDAEGNDFNETAGTYGIPEDDSGFAEAKQALADAGYPDGEGFPEITILYNTSEGHKLIAEMVQEMWKTNLNIEVKLENQEWGVFQGTRSEGNFEVARGGWLTDYDDPMGLLSIFTSTNDYNDPNFYNDEYDKLISEANPLSGQERYDKMYAAEKILAEYHAIVPIYYYTDLYMINSSVQGWGRSVLGSIDFSKAYLETEE